MDFTDLYFTRYSVATQLRCGGMLSNHFGYKFSTECASEKSWKSANIWQRYGQKFEAYFLGPPCIHVHRRLSLGVAIALQYHVLNWVHRQTDRQTASLLIMPLRFPETQPILKRWKLVD